MSDPDLVTIALEAVRGGAAVGVVVSAGERCAGLQGRRVVVGPSDPCGDCEVCRRGGASVCPQMRLRAPIRDGQLVAAGRWVVALDHGLEVTSPAAAAIAGDVTLAYTLYARTGLAPREPAIVTGEGDVARYLVEILIAKGVAVTAVADDPAYRAWLATKQVPAVATHDARAALVAHYAALGLGVRPWRIVAAGAPELAASLAGPRATLTLLAPIAALPGQLIADEVTVIGVAGPHPDLVVEAAAMCVKGEVTLT